jgi:hypothetical protein
LNIALYELPIMPGLYVHKELWWHYYYHIINRHDKNFIHSDQPHSQNIIPKVINYISNWKKSVLR